MPETIPLKDENQTIDISQLKLLGQGRTAEVYLYGVDRVLKLYRPSFPKPAIENEYLVCRAIGSLIDIPRAHSHVIVNGRDAIIFDFVQGVSGFQYILRNPWRTKEFARSFAEIHAKIHSISVPDAVPEFKSILIRNINLHDLLPADAKGGIIDYLKDLPGGSTLCHGDYHPDNLILQHGKPIVLDWMTATRGNPLADVARTVTLLRWAQPGPGTPAPINMVLGAIRKHFCRNYLRRYMELTGARQEEIERWELPVLAARLMEWVPPSEKKLLIALIHEKLEHELSGV